MARIFTSGERLRRRICLLVLFVFIRDIHGSRTSEQEGGARRSGNETPWWPGGSVLGQANRSHGRGGGSTSQMARRAQRARARARQRLTLQWGLRAAARVSFTVETTVLPSFALPRGSCKWEVNRPRETHFSTTNGSNFHERVAASPENLLVGFIRVHSGYSWFKGIRAGRGGRVVAGTRRRGGRAVQSWVKPEVDPPMGGARGRARLVAASL